MGATPQAANLINSPVPYASLGVFPPSPEWVFDPGL